MPTVTPPRLTSGLLRLVLGDGVVGGSIAGDLREEHARRAERSKHRANWWYRREALSVMIRVILHRLRDRFKGAPGSPAATRHERRMGGGRPMMLEGFRMVGRTLRSLSRVPAFSIVTVATLALAIGANVTVFSVVNAVLLEPLPFPEEDRLIEILSSAPGIEAPPMFGVSPEMELQYRDADAIEDLGLYSNFAGTLRLEGPPRRLQMARVSASLFSTLGVQPVLGRLATTAELDADPAVRPALISDAVWRSSFGADPDIVGRSAHIAGSTRTVIGVMGPEFGFPFDDTGAWIPFRQRVEPIQLGNFGWRLVARTKDGVGSEDVMEQLVPLARRLQEDYASAPRYVAFLREGRYRPVVIPMREGMVGDLDEPLFILLGTVGLVLLIACANVANLFLVRTEARQRDFAVRAALGSGRARLIAGQFTEALVLAAIGGGLGVVLAAVGIPLLLRTAPPGLPGLDAVSLDGTVLVFSVGITLGAALLFGLLPAFRFTAPGLLDRLGAAGRRSVGGRRGQWGRNGLVVVQSALALVLLVGSALLVRSFWELKNVDPGFQTESILTFKYGLPSDRYVGAAEMARFHTRFLEDLAGLEVVESVGAVGLLPLDGGMSGRNFKFEGTEQGGELGVITSYDVVTPGFFRTMGIRLLEGRTFENADHEDPWGAVVVNRSLAERYWPGEDPIGKQLRPVADTLRWETVIGVVADVRSQSLRNPPEPIVYFPMVGRNAVESPAMPAPTVVVRTPDPRALIATVRERLQALDATLPVYSIRTMDEVVERSVVRLSFTTLSLGVAAFMALVLGAVGLYGVLSYLVSQRKREIGVRLALGAEPGQVRRMVVGRGLGMASLGLLVGVIGALAVTRFLGSLLFEVRSLDPMTLAGMSLVMLTVAFLASYVPARRASAVDPVESMRPE